MFNNLKIDFNNSREGNIPLYDITSKKLDYSHSFENILRGQLRDEPTNDYHSINNEVIDTKRELNKPSGISDEGKNSKIENQSPDNSPISEKDKIKNAEDNQDDESTIRKTKGEEEEKANKISKDEEKNKKIDENDHKIWDNAEPLREENLLLSECLHLLQEIANKMQKGEGNTRDLKQIIKKLQEIITLKKHNNMNNEENNLDELLTRLRPLLKKLNIAKPEILRKYNNDTRHMHKLPSIIELKDEIANLIKSMKQYLSKHGKNEISSAYDLSTKNTEISDLEPKAIRNSEIGKQFNLTLNNRDESAFSDNSDAHNGYRYYRNISENSTRNDLSFVNQKKNNFNEQLQSIIHNSKVFIKDGKNGSFSVKLYPEELGKIGVNLSLNKGIISGRFIAESAEAREMLAENISVIKERLQEAGISVGEFQINVKDDRDDWDSDSNEEVAESIIEHDVNNNNIYEINSSNFHNGEINLII